MLVLFCFFREKRGEEKNNAKKTVKTMKHEKRGRKVSKARKFGRLQKSAEKEEGVEKHGESVRERKS